VAIPWLKVPNLARSANDEAIPWLPGPLCREIAASSTSGGLLAKFGEVAGGCFALLAIFDFASLATFAIRKVANLARSTSDEADHRLSER